MAAAKVTPKKRARTRQWKPAFLKALTLWPDVSKACAAAGIARHTAYRERQADEQFALAWHDAINVSLDQVEAALIERALKSDTTAAIFLLKSHRRDVYGDAVKVEHSGKVDQSIDLVGIHDPDAKAEALRILADSGAIG